MLTIVKYPTANFIFGDPAVNIYYFRLVQESDSDTNGRSITLLISPTAMVTETKMVKPTTIILLSELGGAMGLWLGIGVMQLVQIFVNGAQNSRNYLKKKQLNAQIKTK